MNGRPNQPRRGGGRGRGRGQQQKWRPQHQHQHHDGEHWESRAGGSETDYSEPRGGQWGSEQPDRWNQRCEGGQRSWGQPPPQHEHQHQHHRPHRDNRHLPDRDKQQQNWRQRGDQDGGMTEPNTQDTQHQRHNNKRTQQRQEEPEQGVQPPSEYPHGTCLTMCPRQEIQDREAQCRLHRFEMLAGTEHDRKPKADPARMVKEYSRPAAGKDATLSSDLRPSAVLLKTVCYLVDEIAASTTLQPWTEVYSFVFDRLRCVRQDMIIQRSSGPDCLAVLERSVRFLLYASYRLCGEPLQLYDPKINDTHLQESLSWLLEGYRLQDEENHDTHTRGTGTEDGSSQSEEPEEETSRKTGVEGGRHGRQNGNREEFEALNLLYNLGCARVTQHVLELPAHVRSSHAVDQALAISRAFSERNPVRLLRLAGRLDFLQRCALHRHLPACRRHLLAIYSHGHSSRNCRYPLPHLATLLALTESQAQRLCQAHGVPLSQDTGTGWVAFSKAHFLEKPTGEGEGEGDGISCADAHQKEMRKEAEVKVALIIHGHG